MTDYLARFDAALIGEFVADCAETLAATLLDVRRELGLPARVPS